MSSHDPDGYDQPMAKLLSHSANGALEMATISQNIHPGTRQNVLTTLNRWVTTIPSKDDDPHYSRGVLWLTGRNGTGKTVLQREFSRRCQEDGSLLASFFFATSPAGESNEKAFVPTLAYQIASNIPGLWDYVSSAIRDDPDVFTRELEDQMDCLVFQPLERFRRYSRHNFWWRRLKASWRGHWPEKLQQCVSFNKRCDDWWSRSIIVVDGLDECVGHWKHPRRVVAFLWRASRHRKFPLRFTASSPRDDSSLSQAFYSHSKSCTELAVDTYLAETEKDLAAYLLHHFVRISEEHPKALGLPSEGWPNRDIVNLLVARAFLLFLYVTVVVKFIDNPRYNPQDLLDRLLAAIPKTNTATHRNPLAELDALYTFILHPPKVDLVLLCRLLNAIIFSELGFHSTSELDEFLSLETGTSETALCDLHSLIYIPPLGSEGSGSEIRFQHRTVREFLTSKKRSGDLFCQNGP